MPYSSKLELFTKPHARSSRGLSLGEILVVLALSALLLGILVQFAGSAFRISNEELERNKTEATLINLVRRLKRDLTVASAAGLSLDTDGKTLLLHPITLSDVGTVVYQDKLVLWHFNQDRLLVTRGETSSFSDFTFDGTPYRAPAEVLATLGSSSDFPISHKFTSISSWKLSTNPDVDPPFIGSPLRLEITAKLVYSRKSNVLMVKETFHLRNSGV